MQENIETFYPKNINEWRTWLEKNHNIKKSIWLIYYKKDTNIPTITWSQAVDEAICFGWIDSTARSIDNEKYMQYFSKRKPTSVWSKINKEKVERLSSQNLITPAGYASIEIAKKNGSWEILDTVEEYKIPEDLEIEFMKKENSKDFFISLNKSTQKSILQWLVLAKKDETRKQRIIEIVNCADQKIKPKQFR